MKRLAFLITALAVFSAADIHTQDEDYLVHSGDEDEVDQINEEAELREEAAEAEDNTDLSKNWQDFSKGSSLSLSVSMNEIERYYIRFPCSESIQFTLHLKGERETNSYIEFLSKRSGRIFCNKARTQSFKGGAFGSFKIPDTDLQCEENEQFLVLEVEKSQQHLIFRDRGKTVLQIIFKKLFEPNVGDCDKTTKAVMIHVGKATKKLLKTKYQGPFSFAFTTSSTGWWEFGLEVDRLKQEVQKDVVGKSLMDVRSYANSNKGSLAIFRWSLMKSIYDQISDVDVNNEILGWILNDREALEMFMTSGEADGKYSEALMIFRNLILQDPEIKNKPLHLRLAVATSLVHSEPVPSGACKRNIISWMDRYKAYLKWSQEGALLSQFYTGTAWHLRFVVASTQTDEETIWARKNTPKSKASPSEIGTLNKLKMVTYNNTNKDGWRVGNTAKFYYYQPATLKVTHEIGGVCGAVSRFHARMSNAFGVPASLVGQPGHAAFIWYNAEGNWELKNRIRGWRETKKKRRYTWGQGAYFIQLMNEAQKNLDSYRLSEKLRLVSELVNPGDRFQILEEAITTCPYNYPAWMELEGAIKEPSLQKSTVQNSLLPVILAEREKDKHVSDIAADKVITSECFGETSERINDPTEYSGLCEEETGSFEIDLERPSTVKAVKFLSKRGKPQMYDIYAMTEDGDYIRVKTQDDAKEESGMHDLGGWDMRTTKIKVDLKEGRLFEIKKKPVYYSISKFQVIGIPHDIIADVSKGKPVTANLDSIDPTYLVDDDSTTSWEGNNDHSWFEIDLKQICALDDIELFWVNDARPENAVISYKVGTGKEIQVPFAAPFNKESLDMECATKIKVEMSGGHPILNGVKARGAAYTAKGLLKAQLYASLLEFPNVRKIVKESINRMEYED